MKRNNVNITVFDGDDNETSLIPQESLAGLQKYDDSSFDKVASGTFLPRVQLMIANSAQCKSGEFPINHYALVNNNNFIDLGATVDVMPICFRPKALNMKEDVIAVYDVEDEQFQKIQQIADSGEADSGCMYGPEFLIWVPSKETFATLFLGSKTARNEAATIRGRIGKGMTLKSREINPKKSAYSWYGMSPVPCTTPFTLPDENLIIEEANRFNNPPKVEVEKVEEASDTTNREV